MKYLDFLYLFAAMFLVGYLAIRIQELSWWQVGLVLVAVGFAAFQYGLRRQMRRKMEDKDTEKKEGEGS